MVKENNASTLDHRPTDTELVDLALSGKCPGLLCRLLSAGLTDMIYANIAGSSKVSPDHT